MGMNARRLQARIRGRHFRFRDINEVLAKANRERSGDRLAGLCAGSDAERAAARQVLADLTLIDLREHPALPPETDAISRVVEEGLDERLYRKLRNKTVGELRDHILAATADQLTADKLGFGLTPEMAAAVAKLMSNLDLVHAAARMPVIARANTTLGLPGTLGVRVQPNHPTDDLDEILAQTAEGLAFGCGDALIGVNPARDDDAVVRATLEALDTLIKKHRVPTQSCVLAHVTTQMRVLEAGAPMGLMFQSLAGTEAASRAFGITVSMMDEASAMATELCNVKGPNVMYFETGQGSELSSGTHEDIDQVTLEARCYGMARRYSPFAVNTVIGFIGPEYLFDASETQRAGLEDHFMGKLLGVPMGVDACQTNHMEGDQNDVENQALLLAAAGANYFMGVPMGDRTVLAMSYYPKEGNPLWEQYSTRVVAHTLLGYRSTSFHDMAALREVLHKRPAPEFERWLTHKGLMKDGALTAKAGNRRMFSAARRGGDFVTRIGVGRAGMRPRLETWMELSRDFGAAKDALRTPLPADLHIKVGGTRLRSAARDDQEFLRNPDAGRRLARGEAKRIEPGKGRVDVLPVLLSGLSAGAVAEKAPALLRELRTRLKRHGLTLGKPYVVDRARLKVADDVARKCSAEVVVALIGDRPGLRAPNSMSVYVTRKPGRSTTDAERSMVSNIHAHGLTAKRAATQIVRMILTIPKIPDAP